MLRQAFIDCMPGPTSHFGGHAYGNLASMNSKNTPSNPQKAALEWLEKVALVQKLSDQQYILPPHRRPLTHHKKECEWPHLSSGFIWMANAANMIPKTDTKIKIHQIIPANMHATQHRKSETKMNQYWFKKLFSGIKIQIHSQINNNDEGAANNIRLWHKGSSLQIWVHGHNKSTFPSRQTVGSIDEIKQISQPNHTYNLQQNLTAINAGVFHNDVISFGFENKLFCHQHAYESQSNQLKKVQQMFESITNHNLVIEIVNEEKLSLNECISTYLFNSQVIITPTKKIILCPINVKENIKSRKIVKSWLSKNYFDEVHYTNIQASLMNGGGPACLRLAIYLEESELECIPTTFKLTEKKYRDLKHFIKTHYPTTITIKKVKSNPNHFRNIIKEIEGQFFRM